jgi:hypothetical protein
VRAVVQSSCGPTRTLGALLPVNYSDCFTEYAHGQRHCDPRVQTYIRRGFELVFDIVAGIELLYAGIFIWTQKYLLTHIGLDPGCTVITVTGCGSIHDGASVLFIHVVQIIT